MIAPRLLSQEQIKEKLEAEGFTKGGDITVSGGTYSVWVSEWGEPLMVPEDGPDKVCADIMLNERLHKVLATRPKKRG
ncbi:MAG: hypothetical protein AB7R40_26445 [Nitrospiraceae bacterium]